MYDRDSATESEYMGHVDLLLADVIAAAAVAAGGGSGSGSGGGKTERYPLTGQSRRMEIAGEIELGFSYVADEV